MPFLNNIPMILEKQDVVVFVGLVLVMAGMVTMMVLFNKRRV